MPLKNSANDSSDFTDSKYINLFSIFHFGTLYRVQTSGRLTRFHKSPRIGQRSDKGTLPGIITNTFVLSIIATNEVDDDAIKKKEKLDRIMPGLLVHAICAHFVFLV